jgi:hypothetical protein
MLADLVLADLVLELSRLATAVRHLDSKMADWLLGSDWCCQRMV